MGNNLFKEFSDAKRFEEFGFESPNSSKKSETKFVIIDFYTPSNFNRDLIVGMQVGKFLDMKIIFWCPETGKEISKYSQTYEDDGVNLKWLLPEWVMFIRDKGVNKLTSILVRDESNGKIYKVYGFKESTFCLTDINGNSIVKYSPSVVPIRPDELNECMKELQELITFEQKK